MSSNRRTVKFSLFAFILALATVTIGGRAAEAAGQNFQIDATCVIRVSGFQDFGKAAASNRDQTTTNCEYLTTAMYYGPSGACTWFTSAGPSWTDYIKVNAGYYTWAYAYGAASDDGYVNRSIHNSSAIC